jgi:sugar phosphate isomerase/epimerase
MYSPVLPRMTPTQAVGAVKAAGYDAIFWKVKAASGKTVVPIHVNGENDCLIENSPAGFAEARRICEDAGLKINGLAFGRELQDVDRPDEIAKALDLAEIAGAEHVRIIGIHLGDERSYTSAYDWTVRLCEAHVKAKQGRNVKTLLHQHYGTAVPSAALLHRVLSQFDPNSIGCIYDVGNMTVEGYEDYRIGLEILGPYVGDVHLKNSRYFSSDKGGARERDWAPLNDGMLDLPRLFQALERSDYRGWVTMSDFSPTDDETRMLESNHQVIVQAMGRDGGA